MMIPAPPPVRPEAAAAAEASLDSWPVFELLALLIVAVVVGGLAGQLIVKASGLDQLARLDESLQHDRTRP